MLGEPVSTGWGLIALKKKLWEKASELLGGAIADKLKDSWLQRLRQGAVPTEEPLQKMLCRSLGNAGMTVGYLFYEPTRKPLGQLITDPREWLAVLNRISETIQNNIVPGEGDYWLFSLIDASKETASFESFTWGTNRTDTQAASTALADGTDDALKRHIEIQFIVWVRDRVPDTEIPTKPLDFEEKICSGWELKSGKRARVAYYDIFCLFVRDELTRDEQNFRAFNGSILASLKQDLEELGQKGIDAAKLQGFADLISQEQNKTIEAAFADFKKEVSAQFEVLQEFISTELDQRFASQRTDIVNDVKHLLDQQTQEQLVKRSEPHADWSEILSVVAAKYQMTPEDVETTLSGWTGQKLATSLEPYEIAEAKFLRRDFEEAATHFWEAARRIFEEAEELEATQDELRARGVKCLIRAGESWRLQGQPEQGLSFFREALNKVKRDDDPSIWAELKHWTAVCHRDIWLQQEGRAAQTHLEAALKADEEALEVRSSIAIDLDWAAVVQSLGVTRYYQAKGIEREKAYQLLGIAIDLFKKAREIRTEPNFPIQWAATESNLALALNDQAGATNRPEEAEWLLGEAVKAFECVLLIHDRRSLPEKWAGTKINLGWALREQAIQSEKAQSSKIKASDVTGLLTLSIANLEEALKVYAVTHVPSDWGIAQNDLGMALGDLAERTADPTQSNELFDRAILAFDDALIVRKQDTFPRRWAATMYNRGVTLHARAKREIDRTKMISLLKHSIEDYLNALKVFTQAYSYSFHEMVSKDLAIAEKDLAEAIQASDN